MVLMRAYIDQSEMEWDADDIRTSSEAKKYISPGALKRDLPPPSHPNYCKSCLPPPANPWNRGCSRFCRCRKGTET